MASYERLKDGTEVLLHRTKIPGIHNLQDMPAKAGSDSEGKAKAAPKNTKGKGE